MALLELQFDLILPENEYGWLRAEATSIPAHGHLPEEFAISASEAPAFVDPQEGYLNGFVGSNAVKAVAELSNGSHLTITPRLPTRHLRETFVWLDGLRYIIAFYPSELEIRYITLFAADGKRLDRSANQEGTFN